MFTRAQDLLSGNGLAISELDGILLGVGPGSYTGLRVAASAVKGMLFGQEVPLYGVNTLAGFAAGMNEFTGEYTVHVIIDARRTHVYTQSFRVGMSNASGDQSLKTESNSDLENKTKPTTNFGSNPKIVSVAKSGSVPGGNSGEFTKDNIILKSMIALSEPSLVEIDNIYDRFQDGDFLIGTGIQRLNPSKTTRLHLREIDKTGAVGLIRIFDAGLNQFYKQIDVTDFEPTYTVQEN
ncbi:MAG TPA: tRNA (adenosine(37)-N6)-threonylcarbamoyltransferase complex dimerization subunit type 1 TsaB [Bacteroidetes bacterium]|nr:tRNA (adenosine(37)-N6)-threonylcarbamoyltransferase complex dimerization subunit type 1 TsaB [Bacteroidota bacterium]